MAASAWLDRFKWYSTAVGPASSPATDTLVSAGLLALEHGQVEAAVRHFQAALRARPDQPLPLHALGFLEARDGQFSSAVAYLRRAAELAPRNAVLRSDLGSALQFAGNVDAAVVEYEQALALDPMGGPYLLNLGKLQIDRAFYPRAAATLLRAQRLAPHNPHVQWALASALLAAGQYKEGFEFYEARFQAGPPEFVASSQELFEHYRRAGIAPWRGEPLAGKRLLVSHEQGIGDLLMTLRYLPTIKMQGPADLIVHCRPEVVRLVQAIASADRVIADATSVLSNRDIDRWCPSMSLPRVCGTRIDNIPNPTSDLSIPDDFLERWRHRTSSLPGLKAGLAWAGDPRLSADRQRSMHLRQLAPLFAVSGVAWVSLQKGPASSQIVELGLPMHDWMDQCTDWLETAALIENLDLVLSVDTAVVHLAGTLGKRAWLLDRFAGDWRWRAGGDVSSWYPSVRIFRQAAAGDWAGVVQRSAIELTAMADKQSPAKR